MEKLFGLEMGAIARALSAILVLVILSLALLAWRHPVFLKLGLRPIPRRRAQSTLIILGLMLATLIITAAFITGDTLSHSIRSVAIEGMGEIDELVQVSGGNVGSSYFKMTRYESLAEELAGYPSDRPPAACYPRISAGCEHHPPKQPAQHRTSWATPGGHLGASSGGGYGFQPAARSLWRIWVAKEVYINAAAAEDLGAAPGDELELYVGPHPKDLHCPGHRRGGRGPAPAGQPCARPSGCLTRAQQDQRDHCLQPGRCAGRRVRTARR